MILTDSGLNRATRLPVSGFLTKRNRFQTIRPIYSSLLRMPLPRRRWPWIVLAAQSLPRGPETFSQLRARAIALGELPAA